MRLSRVETYSKLTLLGLCCVLSAFVCLAEEKVSSQAPEVIPEFTEEQAKKVKYAKDLPPFVRDAMLSTLGIPPNSFAGRHVIDWLSAGEDGNRKEPENADVISQGYHKRLLAHVRFSEGSPIPSQQEVAQAFEADKQRVIEKLAATLTEKLSSPQFQAKLAEEQRQREQAEQEAFLKYQQEQESKIQLPKLESCPEDRTYKVPLLNEEEPGKPVVSDVDWLIISKPVPNDSDVVFGKSATVMQYNTDETRAGSVIAAEQGLWCLPYRIRAVDGVLHHHLGANALKNFDDNEQGVIHESFKSRLSSYR